VDWVYSGVLLDTQRGIPFDFHVVSGLGWLGLAFLWIVMEMDGCIHEW
jgi:hypothetical protein